MHLEEFYLFTASPFCQLFNTLIPPWLMSIFCNPPKNNGQRKDSFHEYSSQVFFKNMLRYFVIQVMREQQYF